MCVEEIEIGMCCDWRGYFWSSLAIMMLFFVWCLLEWWKNFSFSEWVGGKKIKFFVGSAERKNLLLLKK